MTRWFAGRCYGRLWAAVVLLGCSTYGCKSEPKTAQWNGWDYDPAVARSTSEQITWHHTLQTDATSLRSGDLLVPSEIPSNMLTEEQRRESQARRAEALHQQVGAQARSVEESRRTERLPAGAGRNGP
ncbi:MAG: hypothetical protein GY778_23075 [bacterium]|nr:hypothetical protein [bacterium]